MKFLAALTIVLALARPAAATEIELRWNPVEFDVTGKPQAISHYVVYFGQTPRPTSVHHPGDGTFRYDQVVNAGHKASLRIPQGPGAGHWFFAVAAANTEGRLSNYSQELHLAIPDPDGVALPPAPEPAPVPGDAGTVEASAESASCATAAGAGPIRPLIFLGLLILGRVVIRRAGRR